jgi:tRNA threonylcarbamoyladenosine modification (KEOPS) complex  Pcc1 subunit
MRIQFYVSFIPAIYASIKLNRKQFKSNESQVDLERVHQTLKKI